MHNCWPVPIGTYAVPLWENPSTTALKAATISAEDAERKLKAAQEELGTVKTAHAALKKKVDILMSND